jgi:hypothetical protein
MKGEVFSHQGSEGYEDIGVLGQYMPSFRAKLTRKFGALLHEGEVESTMTAEDFEKLFPTMDGDLLLVMQLCLPLGKNFEPLENHLDYDMLRKRSIGYVMIDHKDEDLFASLSVKARDFFNNYPIEKPTSCKRLRVSRVIASWVWYMAQISRKKTEVEEFEYLEKLDREHAKLASKWQDELKLVAEFAGQQ